MMKELLEQDPQLFIVDNKKQTEEKNDKYLEDIANGEYNLNLKAIQNLSSNNENNDSDENNNSQDSIEAYFEDLDKIINESNDIDEKNNYINNDININNEYEKNKENQEQEI